MQDKKAPKKMSKKSPMEKKSGGALPSQKSRGSKWESSMRCPDSHPYETPDGNCTNVPPSGGAKKKLVKSKSPSKSPKNSKLSNHTKGGSVLEDMTTLVVPFGLIAAKNSLEKFINNRKKSFSNKPKSKPKK